MIPKAEQGRCTLRLACHCDCEGEQDAADVSIVSHAASRLVATLLWKESPSREDERIPKVSGIPEVRGNADIVLQRVPRVPQLRDLKRTALMYRPVTDDWPLRGSCDKSPRRTATDYRKDALPIIFYGQSAMPGIRDLQVAGSSLDKQVTDRSMTYLQTMLARQYLDSSIWNRYVFVGPAFSVHLLATLADISWYRKQGLYDTFVALEYLEHSVRAFREGYLYRFKDAGDVDHADWVSVQGGHSELAAAAEAERAVAYLGTLGFGPHSSEEDYHRLPFDLSRNQNVDSRPWIRCLVIDDYARECLRCHGNMVANVSKVEIIGELIGMTTECSTKRILGKKPESVCTCGADVAASGLTCVLNCRDASEVLCLDGPARPSGVKPMHDIILLDYLLGRNPKDQAGGRSRTLGTEILTALSHSSGHTSRGPFGSYWVFPISAFPAGYLGALGRGDIPALPDTYVIGHGVCDPVCTPHFFRYRFFSFVQEMIRSVTDIAEQLEEVTKYIQERRRAGSSSSDGPTNELRDVSWRFYPRLVSLSAKLQCTEVDEANGSVLAARVRQSVAQDPNYHTLEHMLGILRRTIFSPMDWAEMAEDVRALRDIRQKYKESLQRTDEAEVLAGSEDDLRWEEFLTLAEDAIDVFCDTYGD